MTVEGILVSPPETPEPAAASVERGILRSAGTVAAMTALSRLTGVVNQRILAHFLGLGGVADAYSVAYRLPNMLRRFTAEGTMTAAFLPTLSEVHTRQGEAAGHDFAARFLGTLACVMTLLCAVGVLLMGPVIGLQMLGRVAPGAPVGDQLQALGQALMGNRSLPDDVALSTTLSRIMFPYLGLVSLTAGMAAVLNLRGRFALPASVSTFFNLTFITLSLLLLNLGPAACRVPSRATLTFASAVLAGGIVQVLVLLPAFRKLGGRLTFGLHWRHPYVRLALRRMLPGIAAGGIHPINVFVSQMLASQLERGSQTVLINSNLLGELVLGLFAMSVATVSLPAMSRLAAANDLPGVRRSLATALRGTAVMAIPASVGMAVLSTPIVALVYRTGRFDDAAVRWTAGTLTFQAIGLLFIASSRISSQALNAMTDYRGPAQAAALALGANILFSILLMRPMGTAGMALANGLAAMIGLAFQEWRLRRTLGHLPYREVASGWGRMGAAAAVMGVAAWMLGRAMGVFTLHGLLGTSLRLFPLIGVSTAIYFALLLALRVPEASELAKLVRWNRPR